MSPVMSNKRPFGHASAEDYPHLLPTRILLLQRLIMLLEVASAEDGHRPLSALGANDDRLSLMSRLRQAHARYVLGSGPMERIGMSAWVAQRH